MLFCINFETRIVENTYSLELVALYIWIHHLDLDGEELPDGFWNIKVR